jgi:hypothetical protein
VTSNTRGTEVPEIPDAGPAAGDACTQGRSPEPKTGFARLLALSESTQAALDSALDVVAACRTAASRIGEGTEAARDLEATCSHALVIAGALRDHDRRARRAAVLLEEWS